MKNRAIDRLRVVAAATVLTAVFAVAVFAQDARSRDSRRGASGRERAADMAITEVSALGPYKLRVVVANQGSLFSRPCLVNAAIYVDGARSEQFKWVGQRQIGGIGFGKELTLDFDTTYAVHGHRIEAYVFQCAGADATAVNDRMVVSIPAREEEPKAPPPPIKVQKPKISPDLAAADLYFEDGRIVGVVKNVGDRMFSAAGSGYEDSFDRQVTLQRIKQVGSHSYTETVLSHDMPHLEAGKSQKFAFNRPADDPAATEYRWTLVVSGGDADSDNDTFTRIEKVKKGKRVRFD